MLRTRFPARPELITLAISEGLDNTPDGNVVSFKFLRLCA